MFKWFLLLPLPLVDLSQHRLHINTLVSKILLCTFLIAYMLFPSRSTYITYYVATPDESAVAFLFNFSHSRLVPPAAAKESTAIHAMAGPVADPSVCSQDVQSEIIHYKLFESFGVLKTLLFVYLSMIKLKN